MLKAQQRYGPHGDAVATLENASFSRALYRLLPEDSFDRQPYVAEDGSSMLVADVRIDNRDELLRELGLGEDRALSDAELLFRAYRQWRVAALARLVGDFAFAIWDVREQSLTLARDTTGQRPLHYHLGDGFVAFASMPVGLHALDEISVEIDQLQLAGFVADIPRSGSGTYFKSLHRVEPGHFVTITKSGAHAVNYWQLPRNELHYANPHDYVEAYREQLDRATSSRLRRCGGNVAAHLSAGLDSSAVVATAARLLDVRGERLLALTSAPQPDFSGPLPAGRIGDESQIAGATARLYPNIDHIIIRPAGISPLDLIHRDGLAFQEPIGLPCNHLWWSEINADASRRGASVILTGEAGNLTISAGSLAMLSDLLRSGAWLRWLAEARASIAAGGVSWLGVLATSFGPYVPRALWAAVSRAAARDSPSERGLALLDPAWRARVAAQALRHGRGGRPESDNKRLRWQLLRSQDPANFRKQTLARWQLDERDPTADRRVADFCFSLPLEQWLGEGKRRRLARIALRDRLPAQVLDGPRGYQFADWYELIDQDALQAELARLRRNSAAMSLLNLDQLQQLVDSWPPGDWASDTVIATYRLALLRSISGGWFAGQTA